MHCLISLYMYYSLFPYSTISSPPYCALFPEFLLPSGLMERDQLSGEIETVVLWGETRSYCSPQLSTIFEYIGMDGMGMML